MQPSDRVMTVEHDKIGKRLRQIRTYLGETQTVFAERFGLSRRDISNYELGQCEIPSGVLAELDQLGFRVDWLLNSKGEMLTPLPEGPTTDINSGMRITTGEPAGINLRWFLAIPIAFLVWLLMDLIVPPIFGFLIQEIDHVTAFFSHLAAVVAAGYLSSKRFLWPTIAVITVVLVSIRLVMIVQVLDSTGEYIGLYVIETTSALAGLGLGILLVFRNWVKSSSASQAEDSLNFDKAPQPRNDVR
ncbi:MAG: helix-turn-helix domain-containing protein [Candidatus Neomarinimicrobiota bacterium]